MDQKAAVAVEGAGETEEVKKWQRRWELEVAEEVEEEVEVCTPSIVKMIIKMEATTEGAMMVALEVAPLEEEIVEVVEGEEEEGSPSNL